MPFLCFTRFMASARKEPKHIFNRAEMQRRRVLFPALIILKIPSYKKTNVPTPDRSGNPFVPVPRLREAQKIETNSGIKLLIQIIKVVLI
jgi:hypothetical protein